MTVRLVKSICAPALLLVVPAFLAFQIAAKPLFFCAAKVCDFAVSVMPCETADAACASQFDVQVIQGCSSKAAKSAASGCGGCGSEPEPEPVASGCCASSAPATEARGCRGPDTEAPLTTCPKKNSEDPNSKNPCPDGKPVCVICTPARFVAEHTTELRIRHIPLKINPALQASDALAEADLSRALLHAHSPPQQIPARAGPLIRIEQCSFLL